MRTVDHESGAALGAQVRRHLAAPHLPPPAPPGPLQRQIDRTAAEREASLQRLMSQLPPPVPQVTPPPPVAAQDGARVRETIGTDFRAEMPQHGRQHPPQLQQPWQTHRYQHSPGACAPLPGFQQPLAPESTPTVGAGKATPGDRCLQSGRGQPAHYQPPPSAPRMQQLLPPAASQYACAMQLQSTRDRPRAVPIFAPSHTLGLHPWQRPSTAPPPPPPPEPWHKAVSPPVMVVVMVVDVVLAARHIDARVTR